MTDVVASMEDKRWRRRKTSRSPGTGSRVRITTKDAQLTRLDFADHPITSRAHLLDVPSYLAAHRLPALDPFSASKIPLSVLQGCVADHRLDLRKGDILIVHTGFAEQYLAQTIDKQKELAERKSLGWCGVEASEEVMKWHWECGFAAVATDT